jgi:hypothetical protein
MLEEVAQELLGLPLMGASRARARALLAELAAGLGPTPDPLLQEVALTVAGELALQEGVFEGVAQLRHAERLARARGEGRAVARHRLMALRGLGRLGQAEAAAAQLRELEAACAGKPDLADLWHLACAEVGEGDRRVHYELALTHLARPGQDHLRYEVLIALTELHLAGGAPHAARPLVAEAAALAQAHDDPMLAVHAEALHGHLLVHAGLLPEARAALERCVAEAEALGDTLTLVAEGSLLAGLQLGAEDWEGAARAARRVLSAAERRGNWIGLADGAIAWSTALRGLGDEGRAVALLVHTARLLTARGTAASVNLLKARLAELRVELGPERFDPLLQGLGPRGG